MLEDYKDIKESIEKSINSAELESAKGLLEKYKYLNPNDLDIYMYDGIIKYYLNEFEEAEKSLKNGIKVCKFNFDLNYNLATVLESNSDFLGAIKYYKRSWYLCNDDDMKNEIDKIIHKIIDSIGNLKLKLQDKKNMITSIRKIIEKEVNRFEFDNRAYPFTSKESSGAASLFKENYFISVYDNYSDMKDGLSIPFDLKTRTLTTVEMYRASKKNKYKLNEQSILPICFLDNKTELKIKESDKEWRIKNKYKNRYYYYKLSSGSEILSNKEIVVGEPIELKKNNEIKDVVLNIFIDGLSQSIFDEYGMENIMPNTFKYFSDGTICNNVHTVAEWTLPSVASIFTGKYTVDHKVYHPNYNSELPFENKILSENMNEAGYFTAKIDGNWRNTPSYGYYRGIDRTLYKPSLRGMGVEEIVSELIEHLEAFKGTNQFIWSCVFDAHEVADEFEPKISVQVNTDMKYRNDNEIDKIEKSVKQKYSEIKKYKYIKQLKRIDTYLGVIYNYLNENFDEDKILIALLSDHGQSYLVPESKPLLSEERTKVPMMFKGRGIKRGICNELIETIDFKAIISKLECVKEDIENLSYNLPKYFGGTTKRDFTYSESIFPGDTYKATLNFKDYICYFETNEVTQNDGRVDMNKYNINLIDRYSKSEIEDNELSTRCLEIIFKHMKSLRIY